MILNLLEINPLVLLLGAVISLVGIMIAIYGTITWIKLNKIQTSRMDNFVSSVENYNGQIPNSRIIQREISGSLFKRTIINWIKGILGFLGKFTPQKMIIELNQKLSIAGHPANMSAGDFYALKFLVLLAGIGLAVVLNHDISNIGIPNFLAGMGAIIVCLFMPDFWLKKKTKSRQDEIQRGLPDALDMLSVCASAGLGFDQSLQKVSGYWDTELGIELRRVSQEMEMGISRSEALKNLAERLDVDDLSQFVAIVIQAEKIGMSYSDVLSSQAQQLRVQRQYRAREIANKLPGKMIIPIALLIFPALMAVILGPSIPILMNLFSR
jgi:tight adherence protein C